MVGLSSTKKMLAVWLGGMGIVVTAVQLKTGDSFSMTETMYSERSAAMTTKPPCHYEKTAKCNKWGTPFDDEGAAMSHSECQDACDKSSECRGFVYSRAKFGPGENGEGPGHACFRRKHFKADCKDVDVVDFYKKGACPIAEIEAPKLEVYEAYDWDVTYSMVIVADCGESTVRRGAGEDNTYGFCGSPHATQHGKEINLARGRPGYFTGMCTDGTGRDGVAPSAACLGSAAHPNLAKSTYRKLSWCVTPGDDHQFEGKAVPYQAEKCSGGEFGKCGETTCVADVYHPEHAAEEDADEMPTDHSDD